jgi:hypothetical protein
MNKKYTFGVIAIMTLIALGTTTLAILAAESAYGIRVEGGSFGVVNHEEQRTKAPIATSGDNVYIAWWSNKTGNNEVMFRASTDGGKTFGDKINLSNSTKSESQDAQIDESGDRVFVTWWDRNATSNEPLLRTSTDKGATFGPIMKLSANGTIGSSSG